MTALLAQKGHVLPSHSCLRLFEPVYPFPLRLHVNNRPSAALGFIQRAVQSSDAGIPVIGPLALRVGVVDDARKALASAGGRPLQHLQVAVGVAEGQ
ncbi:hypothetical protein G6F24_018557 [Rhizopus arrhizus]|nr:hypothetical protein G6F24_018557 [Rhizopus arrhizus]